jgi:predicted AlkP superfamily phosphohydrolase/phosphomutase
MVGAIDRVLLLGLDGLANDFLEAPVVAESTPNLTSFLRGAARGPLMSTFPPYTGPAWTTITTGVNPGRHGIFGFTDSQGRPVSDRGVRSARIWDYVGEAGGSSVVINVPITYPPREINGVLVSGMPSPPREQYALPETVAASLEEIGYMVDVSVAHGATESRDTLDRLATMTEVRGRAAVQLAKANEWDFLSVIFVLPDRLGHPWWKFLVPGHPHYDTRQGETIRRGARRALAALDQAIGDLLSTIPSGTAVVLCSDHGFGPVRGDVFFDLALAREGLIDASPSRVRQFAAQLARSRLGRLTPTPLYTWVKQRAIRSDTSSDTSVRRAWTTPAYESGVRLADPDDKATSDLVTELLVGLCDPNGAKIVKSVRRREEIYDGPHRFDAPNLLCELVDESVSLHEGLHASQEWVSREAEPWGGHRVEGVVAIQGKGVGSEVGGNAADICPTVLTLLGLEVDSLDGSSLVDPGESKLTSVGSPAGDHDNGGNDVVYSEDQEAAVLEHLRGLGYVE